MVVVGSVDGVVVFSLLGLLLVEEEVVVVVNARGRTRKLLFFGMDGLGWRCIEHRR